MVLVYLVLSVRPALSSQELWVAWLTPDPDVRAPLGLPWKQASKHVVVTAEETETRKEAFYRADPDRKRSERHRQTDEFKTLILTN